MREKFPDRLRRIINGGRDGNNRPTKETMLILFLSGILIFVILLPTGKTGSSYQNKKSREPAASGNPVDTGNGDAKTDGSADEYKKVLERELEDFLSSVAGVGEVKVLIYMKSSREYIVEKDNPTSSSKSGENSDLTKDESTVYTVNGNGDEVPFVAQTKSPTVDGVAVSAKGASNEAVRLQIVKLVMALYGIEANKVEVLAMKEE